MIIHNATIHSPVERFATALHVDGRTIVWMGDEDTAQFRIRAHPDVRVIDAQGLLLTPSFHNAYVTGTDRPALLSQGVSAVHTTDPDLAGVDLDVTLLGSGCENAGVHLLPSGSSSEEMGEFLTRDHQPGCDPAVLLLTREDLAAFATISSATALGTRRAYVDGALETDATPFTGWSIVVIVGDDLRFDLGSLAEAGIPFALGGDRDPWGIVHLALVAENGPLPGRAAFNALTRGAWRLTPGQYEPRGVLRVGAPADFALWETQTLGIQTPDDDASMWSTDERAGTPLLPILGGEEPDPVLRRLFHGGEEVEGVGG